MTVVLLIGATGFIGAALHSALLEAGCDVVATYHRGPAPRTPMLRTSWRQADLARMQEPDWSSLLIGIEAVVNCAGVLQDSAWDSTSAVHVDGLKRLVAASERAHVGRLIHFSAIGANRHEPTAFSRTKRAGEAVVMASVLDWIILRPSVVVGRGAFGGSALFRGLAALPFLPAMPDAGPLQIVQRDDVARTVLKLLSNEAPARVAIDLAGPEQSSMTQIVALYRQWLGWAPARIVPIPMMVAKLLYALGDFTRALGWRPPLGTTARKEMAFGAVGDGDPWREKTGIVPQRLEEALASEPASVQERWFARLYLLKGLAIAIFSLFWIATAIISLTVGYQIGVDLMLEGGAGPLAGPSVIAGAVADLAVGLAIAFRPTARWGLWGALGLTVFYFVAGSLLVPRLWAEPLGPLLKIGPIMALNLILLAIRDDR